jgi:hypothetical protein
VNLGFILVNHSNYNLMLLSVFSIIHTWYQEYALSEGSMRMVMILALGTRDAARLGASSEWK